MSGSDSGGGFSAPPKAGPCESLKLTRNLEAPIAGVADHLNIGDLLTLVLLEGPPTIVVALDASGSEAGGIVPTGQLLECMQQGHVFIAAVTNVRGGDIQLEVRAEA